jgi:HAD superfamily hydrolase (TIGR01509 family)
MIKAVLFDMDGVLIDAKDWHYEALNAALGLFGYEISRYDHLVTYDGLPTREKLKMLSAERGLPVALHGFVNEMKQKYTVDYIFNRCKPTFHHEYALSRLKADGLKIAVCSNSVRRSVELMIERSGLDVYCDLLLSNEDVAKSKPHPEMYQKAMAAFGFEPKECLVVEDNENGVAAARAAGAHVMVVGSVNDVTYEGVREHVRGAE